MPGHTLLPRGSAVRSPVVRALLAASLLLASTAVEAQPISGDGFLFGRPSGTFTLRGGLSQPIAHSDIFSFTKQQLTVGNNAFSSGAFSAEFGVLLSDRLSLQLSGGYAGRKVPSEFRDWVDNNDQPIEQNTELMRAPFSVGLRYYLTPPGRSISKRAYVPSRIAPYVSAGAGVMWYRFRQAGDFFDYKTLDVFRDELESKGTAPAAYGAIGFDVSLHPNLTIGTEARYDVAHSRMSSDFEQFNRIDLSGVSATVGLTFRY